MDIIIAFLTGGLLCMLCQILVVYVKVKPHTIILVLEILGALFVPLGIMGFLLHNCGGGIGVMVMCAGKAFYDLWAEILAGQFGIGSIVTIVMFALIFVLGIIAGNSRKIDS